jgi:hypothetical protein
MRKLATEMPPISDRAFLGSFGGIDFPMGKKAVIRSPEIGSISKTIPRQSARQLRNELQPVRRAVRGAAPAIIAEYNILE